MTDETSAVLPAPPHNFRLFNGRTERLLGWNESGREVYARSPFSNSDDSPEITTSELLPCSPGWYALTFDDSNEDDDIEQDSAEGSGWRFHKYPILGWCVETSSIGFGEGPNKFRISRSMKPLVPDLTDDFEAHEFPNRVSAYIAPDGKVYSYHECDVVEALSFESWCNQKMRKLRK